MTRLAHTWNFRYVIEYQTVRQDEKQFLHGNEDIHLCKGISD